MEMLFTGIMLQEYKKIFILLSYNKQINVEKGLL